MDSTCRPLDVQATGLVLRLLAHYESHVLKLQAAGMEATIYAQAAQHFDELRLQVAALHDARFAWIQVLISRFEFTGALWDAHGSTESAEKLQAASVRHLQAIARFRAECGEAV